MATTTKARAPKTRTRRAPPRAGESYQVRVKIVRLVPRRLLERVVRAKAGESSHGCHKCGSLFVEIEPAFVHCRYCGSLSRIRGASLLAQEEWELRSGMRLAS